MSSVRRHLHIVGFRAYTAEQLNDSGALQVLFSEPLPPGVLGFLTDLSDCILYYRFDASTPSGKPKAYSHFVTTNIGPELASVHPFPASLIGIVLRYRSMGLPDGYLPLMMDFGKTTWLWCNLSQGGAAVVVPKGDREFGTTEREWTTVASDFDSFVRGLQLDLRPLLSIFRVAGLGNIQEPMREWLEAALGADWENRLQSELAPKTRKRT